MLGICNTHTMRFIAMLIRKICLNSYKSLLIRVFADHGDVRMLDFGYFEQQYSFVGTVVKNFDCFNRNRFYFLMPYTYRAGHTDIKLKA